FTAREDRRAVSTGQNADLDVDRTNGASVSTVDARLARKNAFAHRPVLEIVERILHRLGIELRALAAGKLLHHALADLRQAITAFLLVGNLVGGVNVSGAGCLDGVFKRGVHRLRLPVPA